MKKKGKGKPIVGLNIKIWLRLTLPTSLVKKKKLIIKS